MYIIIIKWRCDLSRLLARKITKGNHSCKPASLNCPIGYHGMFCGHHKIILWLNRRWLCTLKVRGGVVKVLLFVVVVCFYLFWPFWFSEDKSGNKYCACFIIIALCTQTMNIHFVKLSIDAGKRLKNVTNTQQTNKNKTKQKLLLQLTNMLDCKSTHLKVKTRNQQFWQVFVVAVVAVWFVCLFVCCCILLLLSLWYIRTGWLGVKHQLTYLLVAFFFFFRFCFLFLFVVLL